MKILVYSDLHYEFGTFDPPPQENEEEIGLILAGDIATVNADRKPIGPLILDYLADRFKWVLFVYGNHEFYHGVVEDVKADTKEACKQLSNVYILDNDSMMIDDVLFIGSTLWTSMDNSNPLLMLNAKAGINDYQVIRYRVDPLITYPLRPHNTVQYFDDAQHFIFSSLEEIDSKVPPRKVVVVTHYPPSYLSCADEYKGDHLNGAFMTEMNETILKSANPPDLWIHGHVHNSSDYMIGDKTRIVCNPRGYYPGMLNPSFNPNFVIEL